MTPAEPTYEELLKELLFREEAIQSLAKYIHYVSGLEPPPHMKLVCDALEAVAEGRIKRLMISMPPGSGKSHVASHYFPAWYLSKYPTHHLIAAGHKQELSDSFGLKVRGAIRSDENMRLFPQAGISNEKSGASEWMTLEGGGYIATAVGANITGRRGHILMGDDLLSGVEAAESKSHKEKLWSWFGADFMTRRRSADTPIILIGTRWAIDDHFGKLDQAERDGVGDKWHRISLPAIAKEDDPLGRKEGEALWPEQFPIEELKKIETHPAMTRRMWHALYQQSPIVDTGGIMDRRWFKLWRQPDPPKIKYVIQAWDTALTATKTSAYSASSTWGVFDDDEGIPNVILLSTWRDRVEWPILRRMAQRMATDYRDDAYNMPVKPKAGRKPDTVLVESKANGQMLIRDLARAGIIATPWNPDKYGDKIARVRLVTDLIENGRVWLPGQPPSYDIPRKFAEEFLDQCVAFPASDSRDMVDTMSMALMRLKVSGWVVNTDDPTVPTYDTPGERPAFY
jgi:predicted phage terminase large subunit-like protein